jgi:hypothetical protein
MSTEQVIKAKLKWPVSIKANGNSSDGVTLNLSTNGAYIKKLKLKWSCQMSTDLMMKLALVG